MKRIRKFSAWMLALAMVFSVFAGAVLPAYATQDDQKGSIRITKYRINSQADYDALEKRADGNQIADGELSQYETLANVTFTLQKVKYMAGMTAKNAVIDSSFEMQTMVTNEDGKASFENLDRGVYLLKEVKGENSPEEVRSMMEPVLVQIPMANEVHKTNEDAPEYLWDVYVYPKNLMDSDAPKIEKHVDEYGNMHSGKNIGDSFPWIITVEIPENIENGTVYRITDQLDTRLDFDTEKVPVVTVPKGEKRTLEEGVHYTFSRDTEEADGRFLTFDFTEAGRARLGEVPEGDRKVTITFYTKINGSVSATNQFGVAIPNQAKLDYTNEAGTEFHPVSDFPDVYTGSYILKKVDGVTKDVLAGAEFGIFKTQSDAEAADAAEKAIQIVTSGEDGYVRFTAGLEYGEPGQTAMEGTGREYWIMELKAPVIVDEDGNETPYNLLRKPVKVVVNATSHLEGDDVLVIENNKTFQLPFTGGIGTVLFTAGGIVLFAAGCVLFLKGRRKEQS